MQRKFHAQLLGFISAIVKEIFSCVCQIAILYIEGKLENSVIEGDFAIAMLMFVNANKTFECISGKTV